MGICSDSVHGARNVSRNPHVVVRPKFNSTTAADTVPRDKSKFDAIWSVACLLIA
jgi:hypothetical protein